MEIVVVFTLANSVTLVFLGIGLLWLTKKLSKHVRYCDESFRMLSDKTISLTTNPETKMLKEVYNLPSDTIRAYITEDRKFVIAKYGPTGNGGLVFCCAEDRVIAKGEGLMPFADILDHHTCNN